MAYVSFDQVPAAKGASTHIEAFVRGLAGAFGAIDLVTTGAGAEATGPVERWPGVDHWELPAIGGSLIERVLHFGGFLTRWLEHREYDVVHFRSNFEGLPILRNRKSAALIFEVNGLPSIELKYRYPGSEDDRELMRKLVAQERACVSAADCVVTPSAVTRDFLQRARGAVNVTVIPNGADTSNFSSREQARPGGRFRLLYFGTLASWQGVDVAIRAVARIPEAQLTVVGTGTSSRRAGLARLAEKLGVMERVAIQPPVSRTELAELLAGCDAVVAPLLWNDRNVVQGCCPLKVLEGMAAGVPVIASDLPVVRELGRHEEELLLVQPGSVDALAAAVERLQCDSALAGKLARNGRRAVLEKYTWGHAVAALVDVYRQVIAVQAARPSALVPAQS